MPVNYDLEYYEVIRPLSLSTLIIEIVLFTTLVVILFLFLRITFPT